MNSENISIIYHLLLDGANIFAVGFILIYLFGTAWAVLGISIYSAIAIQIGWDRLPDQLLELCHLPALAACFYLVKIEEKRKFVTLTIGAIFILLSGLFYSPSDSRPVVACLALGATLIISAFVSFKSDPKQFSRLRFLVFLFLLPASFYLYLKQISSASASAFAIPMQSYLFPTLGASSLLGISIPFTRIRLSRSPNPKDRAYYKLVLTSIGLISLFGLLPPTLTRSIIVSYAVLGSAGLFFIQHKIFKNSPFLVSRSQLLVWLLVAIVIFDGLRVSFL